MTPPKVQADTPVNNLCNIEVDFVRDNRQKKSPAPIEAQEWSRTVEEIMRSLNLFLQDQFGSNPG